LDFLILLGKLLIAKERNALLELTGCFGGLLVLFLDIKKQQNRCLLLILLLVWFVVTIGMGYGLTLFWLYFAYFFNRKGHKVRAQGSQRFFSTIHFENLLLPVFVVLPLLYILSSHFLL
jgi:hypothetical protein